MSIFVFVVVVVVVAAAAGKLCVVAYYVTATVICGRECLFIISNISSQIYETYHTIPETNPLH